MNATSRLAAAVIVCAVAAAPARATGNTRLDDPFLLPVAPTAADDVYVRLVAYCNPPEVFAYQAGAHVYVDYQTEHCPIVGAFIDMQVPLGRLQPGTYTLHLREASSPLPIEEATRTFTVSPCTGTLCLHGGRFDVEATRRISADSWGIAKAGPSTGETGSLWFFTPYNLEIMVKVLDGCALNGHWWVFAAGLTNLEVDLTVKDNVTGHQKVYHRNAGPPFAPIQDTRALPCQ
jgi:hypothetical protein